MAIAEEQFAGAATQTGRRYDLDWLRVIAFGLLIFYHVGMFYVTWGWHVKSVYAGPAAEPLMLLVNPWRLALLFFISGVAIRFVTDKAASHWRFLGDRVYRLGLPILAGMTVIVAPQAYFELRELGEIEPGYLAFWADYLKIDQLYSVATPTWNHLWYVVYLLFYIVIITPFLVVMRRFAEGVGANWLQVVAGGPIRLLLLFCLPFVLYEATLAPHFPVTHNLVADWANHANRFTMFLLGYFLAKHHVFWRTVDAALPLALALSLLIGGGRLYLRANHSELYEALIAGVPVMPFALIIYAWSVMVLLMGLAQRYLNRPSPALTYLTGAVFCYYILHQTITIAAGYYLTRQALGPWLEFSLVTSATVGGSLAGYEIARRIPFLRPWLGIRKKG